MEISAGVLFSKEAAKVQSLHSRLRKDGLWPLPPEEELPALIPLALPEDSGGDTEEVYLTGHLNHIAGRHVAVCPGGLYDGDVVSLYITHLALCAVPVQESVRTAGYDVGKNQISLLPLPPEEARSALVTLVSAYRLGLTRPLPLMPKLLRHFVSKGVEDEQSLVEDSGSFWHTRSEFPLASRYENELLFRGWSDQQLFGDSDYVRIVTALSQAFEPFREQGNFL